MSPHRNLPDPSQSSDRRRAQRPLAVLAAALLAAAALALPAGAQGIRFSTGNDILTDERTQDDLYTFSVALEIERGAYTFALRENAFTDRAAAVRFDETYLTVGRSFAGPRAWRLDAEAGLVHVGHGLFGEDAQNAVHSLLDQEEVELRYVGSDLHPRLTLAAERPFSVSQKLAVGPRLEIDAAPGLRSFAVAGGQMLWQPGRRVAVQLLAGGRYSEADFEPLEPHLDGWAPVARLGLTLADRVFLAWTYNDYGDEREHLTIGYRLGGGGRGGD